jgi:hypothetical protein
MTKQAVSEAYLEGVLSPRPSFTTIWSEWRMRIRKSRCRLIHRSISRPVHGKYRCWKCLQEFETDF